MFQQRKDWGQCDFDNWRWSWGILSAKQCLYPFFLPPGIWITIQSAANQIWLLSIFSAKWCSIVFIYMLWNIFPLWPERTAPQTQMQITMHSMYRLNCLLMRVFSHSHATTSWSIMYVSMSILPPLPSPWKLIIMTTALEGGGRMCVRKSWRSCGRQTSGWRAAASCHLS